MRRSIIVLIFLSFANSLYSQPLNKYLVGNSGCSAGFFCNPGTFESSKSPDGSYVYTGECHADGVTYCLICVKLATVISDVNAAGNALVGYLDYLKTTLNITYAKGYSKGLMLSNRSDIRGVMDYWKNRDNENLKVKGWTNGKYMCVMYAGTKKDIPEAKAELFLNSLLFPGM